MKRFAVLVACFAMLLGLSGCLLDNLVPNVTIPVPLDDFALSNVDGSHQYLHQAVTLSGNGTWEKYKSKIKSFQSIALESTVTQTTPIAVTVKLYVSDTATLTEAQVPTGAVKIGEATLTATATQALTTAAFPVSTAITDIVDDGIFTLYAIGEGSGPLTADFKNNKAYLTVKPTL